jgi:hypothetical protein
MHAKKPFCSWYVQEKTGYRAGDMPGDMGTVKMEKGPERADGAGRLLLTP